MTMDTLIVRTDKSDTGVFRPSEKGVSEVSFLENAKEQERK